MDNSFTERHSFTYLSQIERQCNYAFAALKLMNSKLDDENTNKSFDLNTELYFLATNFIISVANIDKLVLGSGTNSRRSESQNQFTKERVIFLKAHFDTLIKKLPNRYIRNSLEHFDERLDDAVLKKTNLVDHNIIIVDNYADHKRMFVIPNATVLRELIIVRTSRKFYFKFSKKEICLNDVELVLKEIKDKCSELKSW